MNAPNRMTCETYEVEAADGLRVAIGLCRDKTGAPVELVLNRVDRARDDMADTLLSNLAIAASRLLQSRDPETGETL